jgi:hypothetical protein
VLEVAELLEWGEGRGRDERAANDA